MIVRQLSPRQQQIMQLVVLGYSNKAIAHELGVSRKTVETHMTSIAIRLGNHGRPRTCIFRFALSRQ